MQNADQIIKKYEDIIKEEINIKEIANFSSDKKISKTYKPIGSKLSAKFGKDTGRVIQLGKQGNMKEGENGQIIIFDDNNQRTLEYDEYEIAYEGLEGDNIAVDQNIIAKLDLTITPELQKEGTAREISRFLNQMRKEANFNIDQRVDLIYETKDKELINIINNFTEFFKQEALIQSINEGKAEGDIVALFENDEKTINFALKK